MKCDLLKPYKDVLIKGELEDSAGLLVAFSALAVFAFILLWYVSWKLPSWEALRFFSVVVLFAVTPAILQYRRCKDEM